ncbi:iron-sulfur cluster assembly scaffold protein [uncultured Gimesia sp.]|uniref:iron-sulfur cluster assembly scaffold protein n=1 Tax=uncultured Gimesia sp. TaxID=1678688 RepID=UPI0030D6F34D|tara:strand:- start:97689 stop:98099 length:411 start_codon:yes stop_codon:yes gene_type:complete
MDNHNPDQDEEDFLLEHYESEQYRGRLNAPTVSYQILNRTCGDSVVLDLELKNNLVVQAKFEAQGCVISQAAASILCETITDLELTSLNSFDASCMLKAIRIPLSPRRMVCGLLAWEALQKIKTNLDNQVKGNRQQ